MDVKLGGSMRYLPLGPASAVRSRSGVFGVLLSQATPPRIPQLSGLGSGPTGENRPFQSGDTPERRLERLARRREAQRAFTVRHTGCGCHELYGGQARAIGHRARERDRNALRRELAR